jgi:hypothetical protein
MRGLCTVVCIISGTITQLYKLEWIITMGTRPFTLIARAHLTHIHSRDTTLSCPYESNRSFVDLHISAPHKSQRKSWNGKLPLYTDDFQRRVFGLSSP